MASPLLEQRNHLLKVDGPRHGLRVDGDMTRLSQLIFESLTKVVDQPRVMADLLDDRALAFGYWLAGRS